MSCSTAAAYYKLYNRVSAAPASAPTFGGHLHTALEFRVRQHEHGISQSEIDNRVVQLMESEFALNPIAEGDWRNLNWLLTLYAEHNKRFPVDAYTLMRYSEPRVCPQCKAEEVNSPVIGWNGVCMWCNGTGRTSLMVEVPFVFKLFDYQIDSDDLHLYGNVKTEMKVGCDDNDETTLHNVGVLPVYYHGFLDLPVQIGTQIYIQDYKTTSQLGASFWDNLRANSPQKGYAYGFRELTKQNVAGYLVRALRTKEAPEYVTKGVPNKKGESKRMESWFDESFEEQRFHLGEGELDEWRDNTINIVEEWLWHYGKQSFPKRTTSCSGKYGKCQFYEVCWTFPASDRLHILQSGLYKDKEVNAHQPQMKEHNATIDTNSAKA